MPGERPWPALRRLAASLNSTLDTVWRLCSSRAAAVGLAVAAALAIALRLALPQAPPGTAADPAALSRWLAELQMRRGTWAAWSARAGLLTLRGTPGWRLLWGLTGGALLVAVADMLLAWRAQAKSFPWRTVAHLGLLLLLAGALVDEHGGWEQVQSLVGDDRPVGVGPGAAGLYLHRAGDGAEGAVALAWQEGDAVGQGELRAGRPLFIGARTVHLLQAGRALRLRLVDSADRVLPLDDPSLGRQPQPEVTLRFGGTEESRFVSVPARDWLIRVAGQPADVGGSPFAVWVYRGLEATPLLQAPLADAGELTVAEVRLRWQVVPYVDLRVACRPGLGLWAGGWLLLCLGVGLSQGEEGAMPRRRLWALAAPALGSVIWLAARVLWLAEAAPLIQAGLLLLACGAAMLLLAAGAALLAAPWQWPGGLGWALLAWLAGGGLLSLAEWAAGGLPWGWTSGQAWWALVGALLLAIRHGRGRVPRRPLAAGMAGVALLATVATVAGLASPGPLA